MTIAAILAGKGGEVVTASTGDTVTAAAARLAQRRIGAVPVLDADGRVAGVFSERDVIYCLDRDGPEALDRDVGSVMTAPALTVSPADSVMSALALMTRRRVRHLPVLDGDRLVGIVSIGDLVKYRIDRIEADAAAMRDYIRSA